MIKSEEILQNLKLLSFPRLAGTQNEKKAFNILKNKIKDYNSQYFNQEFSFTTFYSKFLPKILFTLLFLLLISFSMKNVLLFGISVLLILIFSVFILNPVKIGIGKKIKSQNIYLKYQKNKKNNENINPVDVDNKNSFNILFISHVDSKGQRFSIKMRIVSYKIWIISFISGFVLIFLDDILVFNLYLNLFEFIALGINLFAVILIILNTTNNKSPGALDNASGVTCVLELLKYYSKYENRLNNYNLWFLFTGAEEIGTMGIRHFYDKIMDFNKKKTIIINFDSIGKKVTYFSSKINPKRRKEEYYKLLKIADKINLDLGYSSSSFGVRSDGIYLKNQDYHGFGFGDPSSYKHVHSINDTTDKVEANLLKKLCIFIIEAVKEIDKL